LCPSGLVALSTNPRHSPTPKGLLMTGVHWLLAHCSVLKVRTPLGPPPPDLRHTKAAGSTPTARRTCSLVPQATSGILLGNRCSVVRKRDSHASSSSGIPEDAAYGTAAVSLPSNNAIKSSSSLLGSSC